MLEIIEAYTNINFTDKQKEDTAKLYDLFVSSGLLNQILKEIPENEYEFIVDAAYRSKKAIYKYRSSILGVLEQIKQDYNNTELDVQAISEQLQNTDLDFLKDIMSKLGWFN